MTDNTDLRLRILTAFNDHAKEVESEVIACDRASFDHLPEDSHKLFGWLPPVLEGRVFVVRYCPEIIAEQLEGLENHQVSDYLLTLTFSWDLHITNFESSREEREALINRCLYDIAPKSMSLLSEIQMRALDAQR